MPENLTVPASAFEQIACYLCGSRESQALLQAEDDLTGKPGRFQFVTCTDCGLAFQNPRLTLAQIKPFYDDEYIAHRKKTDWGWLTPFYQRAMRRHDLAKIALVKRYINLNGSSTVLDIGCGAATFLQELFRQKQVHATGIDFKDLSHLPGIEKIDFRYGLFSEQTFSPKSFDLITMWHFLEHDYDPIGTLNHCRTLLKDTGRLIIEVPRLDSLSYRLYKNRWPGLQAPQHTVLFSRANLIKMVQGQGLEIVDYLPYGAFPPYFYLFTGLAFKFLKGRGLNLDRAILPYFLGQLLCAPLLLFQRQLNLAMQTIICRRSN